jgi:hypothetical protein
VFLATEHPFAAESRFGLRVFIAQNLMEDVESRDGDSTGKRVEFRMMNWRMEAADSAGKGSIRNAFV